MEFHARSRELKISRNALFQREIKRGAISIAMHGSNRATALISRFHVACVK
ncbi:hypothetical protein [Polaromonas sp. CG9_12]|nr:hypothetical protein [Polaromonas sp. CG9_12]